MSSLTSNAKFISAHVRALVAVASLLTCALLDFVALFVHFLRLLHAGPFSETASDVAYLEGTPNFGAFFAGLTGLAQLVVYVATVVLFLVWQHRAYKNLRAFASRTDFSPGWSIGCWFVPLIHLVLPYQAVKEIWIKSDPAVDFSSGYANMSEGTRSTALVGVWWLFWIVSNIAGRVYFSLSGGGNEVSDAASRAGLASNILALIAALLAAAVVWTIDRMQNEKSQRLGLNLWSSPPPPPASFDPPPYGSGV
jgi:hypothetical protein